MRLNINIITLFTILIILFSNGGNLYAQESNEGGGALPPDDDVRGPSAGNVAVGPLLQMQWSQRSPYNDLFPYLPNHSKANNRNGRLVTDCGTTAAAMLIAFHKHPARAVGQSTTLGPHGINLPLVKFQDYTFKYTDMRNTYTDTNPGTAVQRKAAAELMFIYGMARGSGGGSGFSRVITNHFDYDRSIESHQRRFYTDADWEALIRKELDAGFPVFYYGNYPTDAPSSDGYHAFVVDGYDNEGKFHANWGWNGSYDGWYFINDFDPKAPASTYAGENVVINIRPNKGGAGSSVMGLRTFSAGKTTVQQNELFTVSYTTRTFGFSTNFERGAALMNTDGSIAAIIGTAAVSTAAWVPGSLGTAPLTINCIVPGNINPGQYKVMAVTKPRGGDWQLVTLSAIRDNVPNAINITVTAGEQNGGGYGIGLTKFSPSKTSASVNEQFQVEYGIRNMSNEPVSGVYRGIALVDNSVNFTVIGSFGNTAVWYPGSSNNNLTINCTVPPNTQTGSYRLRVVIRTINNSEWRFATLASSGIPTSIPFTVR